PRCSPRRRKQVGGSSMHVGRVSGAIGYAALALLIVAGSAVQGRAQDHDDHHGPAVAPQKLTPQQNDLVRAVREATQRFSHVTDPTQVGDPYALLFGCVSGGDFGAMGLHLSGATSFMTATSTRTNRRFSCSNRRPTAGVRPTAP